MRTIRLFAAAAATLAFAGASAPASAQSTTRIETRPFYGATVTLEEGVRVFRPLPVDRHVIINPEGQTPLALGFNETNVYERRVVKNYNYNEGPAATGPRYVGGVYAPGYGYGYGYGPGKGHGGGDGPGHGGGASGGHGR